MISYALLYTFTFLIRTEYCCSNFEEFNNTCIECKKGFLSRHGSKCLPCKVGHYGKRCLLHCNCSYRERCDNVVGCRLKESYTSVFTEVTQLHTDAKQQSKSITLSHVTYTISNEEYNETTPFHTDSKKEPKITTFSHDTHTSSKQEYGGISTAAFIAYSSATTGVILILVLCLIFHKYKRHNAFKSSGDLTEQHNDISEIEEFGYHTIDESRMLESLEDNDPHNLYLEVIDTSSSSEMEVMSAEKENSYRSPEQNPKLSKAVPVQYSGNQIYSQNMIQPFELLEHSANSLPTRKQTQKDEMDMSLFMIISSIFDQTSSGSSKSDENIACTCSGDYESLTNSPFENRQYTEIKDPEHNE